jgi:alkanesulfonate monooxygenase SsuD/methylene tetrahydromethanopterin reductase-like flavin-dependent oxidoreductase (luciferase family)
MLAVNVSVGEDAADARRLVASAKGFYARLARLGGGATVPTAEEALGELTVAQHDEPTAVVTGQWPRFVAGDPDQVRRTLDQMLAESAADELMVQNLIADPDDRRASHERLAAMFALGPRGATTPGT